MTADIREILLRPGRESELAYGLDRGSRLPRLYEVDRDLPTVFRELEICVVGVGSVGASVVDQLARLGVGRLLLVDPARLKQESLITHSCVPAEVGLRKVVVAGERAKAVSPKTRVFVLEGPFDELPLHALASSSYVLLATDNLRAEAEVGRRVLELGIPLLQGSVYGPTLSAQVRALAATDDGEGPCLMCGFGQREFDALDRGTVFSCGGSGGTTSEPTASLPQLCSIAADLCTLELTRRAVGIADARASSLIDYCGFTHATTRTTLERRSECPQEHRRMRVMRTRSLHALTPLQLIERAGYHTEDPQRVTLAVEGFRFASLATCGCPRHPTLCRFLPLVGGGGSGGGELCDACGQERLAHPLHVHEQVRASALAANQTRSLALLGAGQATAACVRGDAGAVLFCEEFPDSRGLDALSSAQSPSAQSSSAEPPSAVSPSASAYPYTVDPFPTRPEFVGGDH